MRSGTDIEHAINVHGSSVWRACMLYFSSRDDAQDVFQDTFVAYALADEKTFCDEEHRRAWLLRVAVNKCKDVLKSSSSKTVPLDETMSARLRDDDDLARPDSFRGEVVDAMRALPDPPKTPLYLSICEQYTAPEIAEALGASVNTVYSWIHRGRKMLEEALS